jgi:nucleoside-diphosphate-sugar epimerase
MEFERVNAEGTAQLARAARIACVRRVVYVSSIGVHGASSGHVVFNETSPLRPHNAYARSKARGEAALRAEAGQALEFVIVRPPLIYGVGVPANFRHLMRLVASGVPLPFASLHNLRSLAAVGNVVDFLLLCGSAARASGEVFVVADGEDLSTPDLIRTLAHGLGKSAHLVPFPIVMLETAARVAHRQLEFEQLCGNLRIDAAKARAQLGWMPKLHAREELTATARWYAQSQRRQ